jgi:hypothetical protein
MALVSIIFGLLAAVCAVIGILTAVDILEILPLFASGGELIGPVVFDTAFWWGLAVILLLACIAISAFRIAKGYE